MRTGTGAGLTRAALLIAIASAVPVGALAFRASDHADPGVALVPGSGYRVPGDSVMDLTRSARRATVISHDPFRRSRTAPDQRYDAAAINRAQQAAAAPAPPKPILSLTGIAWGARPAALLDGIPGQEGSRLLRPGDTAGGIRLRSLTQTRAILAGFDTVWSLVIREPWK